MPTVHEIAQVLEQLAPLRLAEEWDNVGLLVGHREQPVARLMTCLTLTPASVSEAVDQRVDLVVTHHPLPFRPLKQVTSDSNEGRMLLRLIAAGVAVYSPHTAFDSAQAGINAHLAAGLKLQHTEPLLPSIHSEEHSGVGTGRCGALTSACRLTDLVAQIKALLEIQHLRVVADDERRVQRVAIACGSGGSLLSAAVAKGADCLITGETSFHTCLAAEAEQVALVLTGHFTSERLGLEWMAKHLASELTDVACWASRCETDPLRTV